MCMEGMELTDEIDSVLTGVITGEDNTEAVIDVLCKCRVTIRDLQRLLNHAECTVVELRNKLAENSDKIKKINNVLEN